jgi:hypothetical protein
MPEFVCDLNIANTGTRNDIRMAVVNAFSSEIPGTGKDSLASRYTYYVETLKDGRRVYLRRPANLHNGFDFIVCVENTNFNPSGRKRNYPTHDDIINDLTEKFTNNPSDYETLYPILKSVHDCQPIANYDLKNMNFKTGFPCDLIIKVLKWLFIEQDIRYWNYSGRDMLWNGIQSINNKI